MLFILRVVAGGGGGGGGGGWNFLFSVFFSFFLLFIIILLSSLLLNCRVDGNYLKNEGAIQGTGSKGRNQSKLLLYNNNHNNLCIRHMILRNR